MEWTKMMDVLSDCGKENILTVYWENELILTGIVDTISETCTCELDEDDPNYQEYYMCILKIISIMQMPRETILKEKVGDLVELSILHEPLKIEENEKGVIWKKS
jgi:hypothetical protein